ncbi:MAG: hypothetical protein BroJett015_25800 [Chloroflexota bacterium]|nr:hypothetical protein [Ardenticatenaceae bacterium]GIK56917.1 MAG: hypothetical protein BroJett015_25800 [Chloroflexota bacterium]
MIWLEAIYQPTTLFSLRPSWATSTGGKTLLLPTPYALKLALLDVALRTSGQAIAEPAWPWIRDLQIGIRLPRQMVVTNLFAKILRLRRNPADPGAADFGPFQKTIGYREYVYHPEPIHLAFGAPEAQVAQLMVWLLQVNYLGKRGGFIQLLARPRLIDNTAGFVLLTTEMTEFPLYGLVQQLDDCDPRMTFAHADIYNSKKPQRIMRQVVLPYRLKKSSRSYSLYEQVE